MAEQAEDPGGVVDTKCRYNRQGEGGGQGRRKAEKNFSVYIFLVLP